MLLLDDMREAFSRKLSENPAKRCALDNALMHVIKIAYEAGIAAGKASMIDPMNEMEASLLSAAARLDQKRITAVIGRYHDQDAVFIAGKIIDGWKY